MTSTPPSGYLWVLCSIPQIRGSTFARTPSCFDDYSCVWNWAASGLSLPLPEKFVSSGSFVVPSPWEDALLSFCRRRRKLPLVFCLGWHQIGSIVKPWQNFPPRDGGSHCRDEDIEAGTGQSRVRVWVLPGATVKEERPGMEILWGGQIPPVGAWGGDTGKRH